MRLLYASLVVHGICFVILNSCRAQPSRSCGCSQKEAAEVKAEWRRIKNEYPAKGQQAIFHSILEEIERKDTAVAGEMKKAVDPSSITRMFSKVELYISIMDRPDVLHSQLLHDIRRNPEWALKALTLIPQTGDAIQKVLSKIVDPRQKSWQRCISQLGKTVLLTIATATLSAECRIQNSSGDPSHPIEGFVTFNRKLVGGPAKVSVDLRGFNKSGKSHGFHIHKVGQLGNRCNDAGPHFNPENKEHGAPFDQERHVGDLGNVVVDESGRVIYSMQDHLLALSGPNSIVGRSVVVHADFDDLGRGGFPDSKTTGHAGGRIGCCIIEEL